eukprot:scaffold46085_cov61-Phaeocystis_antarctica.AAC.1
MAGVAEVYGEARIERVAHTRADDAHLVAAERREHELLQKGLRHRTGCCRSRGLKIQVVGLASIRP